jgi:aminopeptidase N
VDTTPQVKRRLDYTKPAYTIDSVELDVVLDDSNTIVTSISQVRRLKDESLHLSGSSMKLLSVSINDTDIESYELTDEELIIHDCPKEFFLCIVTELAPAKNLSFEGLYKSGGAFCTQCEAEGFRRITYYLDRPDVLATFTTTITAPKNEYPFLLSNGNRVSQEELENGLHRVVWKDPIPKPSYLFALVAGDFDLLEDHFTTVSGREVKLELFVDRGALDRTEQAMTSLKNGMKWDEDRFGLEYDLDIYMIVAVDFFNMGAMENKGLNVFNSKFVLANSKTATDTDYLGIEAVIGHEYFHNWTGNRVTCRDWFQLSLKEGLTVFRDQEFSSDLGSRAVNRIHNVRLVRNNQFAEDAGPMSHPIRPEEVIEQNNFYTVTVYEKGSEVIRMMHTLLGEEKFQSGMKLYFERHDGSAVTCDDFVCSMEDASDYDLTQFRRWYSQSGTPVITVTEKYNSEKKQFTLTVHQETPPTADKSPKEPLHIPLNIALFANDGREIPLVIANKPVENVLSVKDRTEEFIFDNVTQKPILSLLREFSAPVKVNYEISDNDLAFLLVHESNLFAKWDASQTLLQKHIKAMVSDTREGIDLEVNEFLVETFRKVVTDTKTDPALIAEILSLPSESEIAGWFEIVDVDAIHSVISKLKKTFASQFQAVLIDRYNALKLDEYTTSHEDMAIRSLRNELLGYIAYTEEGDSICAVQFENCNNMTDSIAALGSAVSAECNCAERLLEEFSERWNGDGLVMDKWFMIQARSSSANALERVKSLMNHNSFDFSNPNRLRSLIGAFVVHNQIHFHNVDGSGYAFLGDQIEKLNSSNPQVAARLIDPLLKLNRYSEVRKGLMKEQLERLLKLENLANDLFEKITKALDQ